MIQFFIVLSLWVCVIVSGEISHDEAKCILENKKIAFLGGSVTRYCVFGFNFWLETGELPDEEYVYAWGNSEEDYDCCNGQTWTRDGPLSASSRHRQWFYKSFDDINARSDFYFIQGPWYGAMEKIADDISDYDIIVYNVGLWDLNANNAECAEDWSSTCRDDFRDGLETATDKLLDGKIAVWRSTTCCGVDEDCRSSIELLNDEAKDVVSGQSNVGVVDAYSLWDIDDLDDSTTDGFHATVEKCFEMNSLILKKIGEIQGRSGGGDAGMECGTLHPLRHARHQPRHQRRRLHHLEHFLPFSW